MDYKKLEQDLINVKNAGIEAAKGEYGQRISLFTENA